MNSMRRDLTGKVALVTGSARRLGRHLAISLGRAGCNVVVHHNQNSAEAKKVVEEIQQAGSQAWAVKADFMAPGEAEALLQTANRLAGPLDILVNNVGNYDPKPVLESSPQEWREILEVNLVAPQALIRKFAGQCPEAGGHIINIGYAGVENLRPHQLATAYQISKTGLLIMTKTYGESLASQKIRCNMISPGHLENSIDLPSNLAQEIPLARAGRLEDIEDALHYLLDFDGYTTGINMDVAGGYRL